MGEAKVKAEAVLCQNCRFATPVPGQGNNIRHCRRVPPISSPLVVQQPALPGVGGMGARQAIQFMSSFPTVRTDDWCGEFVPRVAIDAPFKFAQPAGGDDAVG